MLARLDATRRTLVAQASLREWYVRAAVRAGRRGIMLSNVSGPLGDARLGAQRNGYGAAIDGLRTFDGFTAALRSRQDVIQRSTAAALASAAGPAPGHAPAPASSSASALASAFAVYAGSESGRANLEGFAKAAAGLFGRFFGTAGPEQLRLPLAE